MRQRYPKGFLDKSGFYFGCILNHKLFGSKDIHAVGGKCHKIIAFRRRCFYG